MDRRTAFERTLQAGSLAVIVLVPTAIIATEWIRSRPPAFAPPPPVRAPDVRRYRVSGTVFDFPGLPVDRGVLLRTRVALLAGDLELTRTRVALDGAFSIEAESPSAEPRLRITTSLTLTPFDRSLDREIWREVALDRADVRLGPIALPRSPDFGSISGQVLDAAGAPLVPASVELDAVEGTSTPPVGIARLGDTHDDAANAPTEYRKGHRFMILHVPPGRYRLRAKVPGRFVPPVEVTVGLEEANAALSELPTRRRFRGTLRDSLGRRPLADAELIIASAGFAGPGTRDPLRIVGRTSIDGAFDLPLPDVLPPEGLRVTFTREFFRSADLRLREGDLRDGTILRDLELVRE